MVDALGIDGMSTDESGDEKRFPATVISKDWRSNEVVALLQYVDRNQNQLNCFGNYKPGGQPHERNRSAYAPVSKRTALAGLPINFYNPVWYEGLTATEQRQLQAKPAFDLPTTTTVTVVT